MLKYSNIVKIASSNVFALLISISIITFQTKVSADTKLDTAKEYRDHAYAEQQKGNLNEALTFYTKALSLGLENSTLFNDMGILYEQLNIPLRAEQFYLRAIKLDKFYLPAYTNLAYLYYQRENTARAAEYFQLRYELADEGDPWSDIVLKELLKIRPNYRYTLMEREIKQLNDDIVEKQQKEFSETIIRANEHFEKGEELFGEGRFKFAIMEYNQALAITPGNAKFIKAKKKARLELTKKTVQAHSDNAMRMLNSGDPNSAKLEIQKMLTTIPSESTLNSR